MIELKSRISKVCGKDRAYVNGDTLRVILRDSLNVDIIASLVIRKIAVLCKRLTRKRKLAYSVRKLYTRRNDRVCTRCLVADNNVLGKLTVERCNSFKRGLCLKAHLKLGPLCTIVVIRAEVILLVAHLCCHDADIKFTESKILILVSRTLLHLECDTEVRALLGEKIAVGSIRKRIDKLIKRANHLPAVFSAYLASACGIAYFGRAGLDVNVYRLCKLGHTLLGYESRLPLERKASLVLNLENRYVNVAGLPIFVRKERLFALLDGFPRVVIFIQQLKIKL